MSWDKEVQELQRRRYLAQQQGGEASIAKQHARGRMTIRERIDVLLDDGSFREHGRATASPVYDDNDELLEFVPANYVVGFGAIEGRRVTVGGEDFTLKGGSPNAAGLRKSVYAEHLAVQYRTPLVRMLEGGGGSVKGGGKKAEPSATRSIPSHALRSLPTRWVWCLWLLRPWALWRVFPPAALWLRIFL